MSRIPKLTLLLVLAVLVGSCHQPTGPAPVAPSYFITPPSLAGNIATSYSFSMRSSDSTWRAYKYVWDFGDGSAAVTSPYNASSHSFADTGTFTITATAKDSLDHVIAVARSVAFIGVPFCKVAITPSSTNTSSLEPILFRASNSGNLPVTYEWDFGDGAKAERTNGLDTAPHEFENDGTYRVIVNAFVSNHWIGSDTATVTVHLLRVACADLCRMFSVTARIQGCGDNEEFTIALGNRGDYSLAINGNSFTAALHRQVLLPNPTGERDTFIDYNIAASVSLSGRYLLLTTTRFFDSTYYKFDSLQVFRSKAYGCTVDSLLLVSAGPDSIVFQSRPCIPDLARSGCDKTVAPTVPNPCGGTDPIVLIRTYPCIPCFRQEKLIFRQLP